MRFLLKILFAPILAVLAVVSWFLVFVVGLSSGILCIPAAILGFFGLFILFVAGWWQSSMSYAICFGTGYMDKAVFRNTASSKSAEHIAPRFSFYSIS